MNSPPDGAGGPQRGMRNDQLSGLILMAFALYVGWQNRAYPLGTLQDPGPGYMPLLLSIFLGCMGLLIVLRGSHSQWLSALPWPEARRAVLILLVSAAGTFALERLGYRLTMMVLLIFFLGVIERKRPVPVVLISIGFAFISDYVVGDLLLVPLPRSPWGF
jgi:putative tricarboxylic transport membrane protein